MALFDDKINAFTRTALAFTQPAIGESVVAPVDSSAWMPIGLLIFCEIGGSYTVVAKPDDESVTLVNLGGTNAVAGTVIPERSLMSPGGATPSLGASPIVLHDATYSPVALWQLNGVFTDTSGSGITLTFDTVKAWTEIWPGLEGWDMIGGARLDSVAPSPAALALTGDMTFSAFVKIPDRSRLGGSALCLVAYEANTGAASGNALWHIGMNNNQLRFLSQHGSQVLDQYLVADRLVPEGLLLLDVTRTAGVPQFYVNGLPFGAAGSALTTPTGGSSSTLTFGGLSSSTSGSPLQAGLASVAIYGTALSAAQIKAKYNRCFGPVFGVRS